MKSVTVLSAIVLTAAFVISDYYNTLTVLVSYYFTDKLESSTKTVYTVSELSEFNGLKKPELYLAILGVIYNVTKGVENYGFGKTYNGFVGRDASRSFVTGKFGNEHLSDDLTGLSTEDIYSLNHWIKFYKQNYEQIGVLIGRYYHENGKETPYNKQITKLIEFAEFAKRTQELENFKYPPCNVEWNADVGKTRVWCTKLSGGIERSWVGVPRKLYEPGSQSYRCACISDENKHLGNIQEYEGCDANHNSCEISLL